MTSSKADAARAVWNLWCVQRKLGGASGSRQVPMFATYTVDRRQLVALPQIKMLLNFGLTKSPGGSKLKPRWDVHLSGDDDQLG